jgi:type I restriction enzyme S subunit
MPTKPNTTDGEVTLPEGWASTPVTSVCELNPRKPPADALPRGAKVTFVPMAAVDGDRGLISEPEIKTFIDVRKGYTAFRNDDVILAKITPCFENGKAAIARGLLNGVGFGSTEFHVFRPNGAVLPEFLFHFLRQKRFREWAVTHMTGTAGQERVPTAFIEQLEVPLPPLAEQQRIVAKLVKVLGKVDACQKRLAKIPVVLKRFRQSVLDAATTGKLTTAWRNNGAATENARSELESLLAAADNQRSRKREAEATEGHEGILEAVPEEWASSSLDDLFRFIDYRGRTPKKSARGKRLISAKNIKMGYIADEPVEYVSEAFYRAWMTRGFPKKGDIFFVTEGHTMGFAALNNRDDEFALSQRTIALQPWQPLRTRCFLCFIMSSLFQNLVRLNATGSAAVGIKAAKFRGLPIPFPPLTEQQEIVRRVEALFALADDIDVRLAKAQAHVDKLTTSLLAQAFHGELVPTEAELARQERRDYEPASVLLERIQRERNVGQSDTRKEPPLRMARVIRSAQVVAKSKARVTQQRRRIATARSSELVRKSLSKKSP